MAKRLAIAMEQKPIFFWQGLLTLLPVALLAGVGSFSLWKDRAMVTLEARQTAEEVGEQLADAFADRFYEGLENGEPTDGEAGTPWSSGSLIDGEGRLGSVGKTGAPGAYPLVPQPNRLPAEQLDGEAGKLWKSARSAEPREHGAAMETYRRFLGANPPEPFRSHARFALARLLSDAGEHEAALEVLDRLQGTVELTEAGLPMSVLAEFQRVLLLAPEMPGNQAKLRAAADRFGAAVVERPSLIASRLFEDAAEMLEDVDLESAETVRHWQAVWARDEATRDFHARIAPRLREERVFWTDWNGRPWLVMVSGDQMQVYPEFRIREAATELLRGGRTGMPDYLAATLALNGRLLFDEAPEGALLARIERATPAHLQVILRLADPDALYTRQRQRALLFGSLIFLAVVAAVAGFGAGRSAFRRQVRLNEMKSNFVASVSHELRAPIASVRLMAEGLDRGAVRAPEKQREYFRFIVRECGRLSSLIENVLDFSRIEQGQREYEFEPTDLEALVVQTVELMRATAAENGVRLETTIAREISALESEPSLDGKAIQQALINLLDNAIKHSPADSAVVIRVTFAEAENRILISVEDRGEGVPIEERERIFDRFYRVGSELRRKTRGAGIGLSVVKHIAEAHGGEVFVESRTGGGSRFTLALSVRSAESVGARKPCRVS